MANEETDVDQRRSTSMSFGELCPRVCHPQEDEGARAAKFRGGVDCL